MSRYEIVNAAIVDIHEDLANELMRPLLSMCVSLQGADSGARPDVIFCEPDTARVAELRRVYPASPIVVVSRQPEVTRWLDSIEAGATDYCAAPFDLVQLQWIVENSLRTRH